MQVYPAIKASMGRWDYFLVRMSMQELAMNIKFAEEVHGATQLSDAIQRSLRKSRVKDEIARYLVHQEDRFFSSIVVAALGGEPQWFPVSFEEDPQFTLLMSDRRLSEAFGVLRFNGQQDYYALDGQHRLAAIRSLIDGTDDYTPTKGFKNEEMAVLIVTPRQLEDRNEFMIRYRRLFGHLNRYAKRMSQFDNIVMDEDDPFAIITRRLVTEHKFFRVIGDQFESARIKMSPGKAVRPGSSHFTSLEILYELNIRLLSTPMRRNSGWGQDKQILKFYKRFRPQEEEIESLADELFEVWDALLAVLSLLHRDPSEMRVHNPRHEDDGEDCVLFWPIAQHILMDLTRDLLDDSLDRIAYSDDEVSLTPTQMREALSILDKLIWDAHSPPWCHILLVQYIQGSEVKWRIANEDRKERMRVAERILRWQIGLDKLGNEGLYGKLGLQEVWKQYIPTSALEDRDQLWKAIEDGVIR